MSQVKHDEWRRSDVLEQLMRIAEKNGCIKKKPALVMVKPQWQSNLHIYWISIWEFQPPVGQNHSKSNPLHLGTHPQKGQLHMQCTMQSSFLIGGQGWPENVFHALSYRLYIYDSFSTCLCVSFVWNAHWLWETQVITIFMGAISPVVVAVGPTWFHLYPFLIYDCWWSTNY